MKNKDLQVQSSILVMLLWIKLATGSGQTLENHKNVSDREVQ